MGAFREQLHITSHNNPIPITWHIPLIVIYSRSRISPPSWDLNQGKLCYLVPVNRPPSPTSLNTHCEEPSMAYSSAIPRHIVASMELSPSRTFAICSSTISLLESLIPSSSLCTCSSL